MLSVTLWYHFAFLIVSTALLGLGLSGVLLAISTRLRTLPLNRGLSLFAAGQGASILLGFILANRLPFAPFSLLSDPRQLLYSLLYVICLATPFVFSGLYAALLLSRQSQGAGRIYFFDLLGAGLGCFTVVLVMPLFGASGSILICTALAVLALVFLLDGARRLGALGLVVLLGGAGLFGDRLLPLRISPLKTVDGATPIQVLLDDPANLFTGWNTFSRIDVLPSIYGREILIDAGTASTRMPRLTQPLVQLGPIEDERQLVLQPARRPSVLVIGSGGGWEVVAALRNQARRVVAVEVNPIINRLVTQQMADYVGHLFADPRVELHTDEARSFIRRSTERFDVIMASHTISNAATASGALSLAENYLITREAFGEYLDHLQPRGYLWFTRPEAQLPRLAATAREALVEKGISHPGRHLMLFAADEQPSFNGVMVVSRAPLAAAELEEAARLLTARHFRVLYLPRQQSTPPGEPYRTLLQGSPAELARLYRNSPTQLRPASDDRPFFNHRTRWRALDLHHIAALFNQGTRGRMALEEQPVAEVVLLVVLLQSTVLALVVILIPLYRYRRASLTGSGTLLAYFFLLGIGFILVEIALVQRLTLFLGQPVYTFAAVIGVLLLSSGLGSLITTRLVPRPEQIHRRLPLILVGIAGLITLFALGCPPLLRLTLGTALPLRLLLVGVMLFPLGCFMGMAFPLGLRQCGWSVPEVIPWAWGLNAIASVMGSVLAIILATLLGFTAVFLLSAVIYALAALLWRVAQRLERSPPD